MNNILKPLSFLFLFITFITGCNKNEPILPNVKQVSQNNIDKQDVLNNINLEDGVLNFTSKDYIVKTQYILAYDSTNSFKKRLNEKFPNFISSIIAFKSLTQQDTLKILNGSKDYKDYVRLIDENNVYSLELNSTSIDLCRLLNKKGLISFGDSIVKLTYDNVFVTTKAYYQSLGKPDLELIKDAGVHTTPLIHRLQKNTNKATLRWNIDYVNSDFNIGGVPRRQSEVISEDWNYFSWQLTFTSKYMYQGNFLGIFQMYYNDQAQVIYHYGNVSFYYPSDNVTYNVPFYKSQNDVGIITSSIPSDYNFGTYNGEAPVAVSWYALGAIQVYYENNYRYVTLAH